MTGEKLVPLAIVHSERQRAPKDCAPNSLGRVHRSNKSSWMMRIVFEDWLHSINETMAKKQRRIAHNQQFFWAYGRVSIYHAKIVFSNGCASTGLA
jgi:hypothetical protein